MRVTLKQSIIYRGKLYRRGDNVDVDEADLTSDLSKLNLWTLNSPPPDVIDEPAEAVTLPPLESKKRK